jgi:dUTP pyrophosphatase
LGLKILAESVNLPKRATKGSAGMDIEANENVVIAPFARALVSTGLAMQIPEGYEVQLRPRSGLAIKHGVTLLNSPATIDSDYQGEVKVILINLGNEDFHVVRGMRIAQMVISKVIDAEIKVVKEEFAASERGSGGFGSTGT